MFSDVVHVNVLLYVLSVGVAACPVVGRDRVCLALPASRLPLCLLPLLLDRFLRRDAATANIKQGYCNIIRQSEPHS